MADTLNNNPYKNPVLSRQTLTRQHKRRHLKPPYSGVILSYYIPPASTIDHHIWRRSQLTQSENPQPPPTVNPKPPYRTVYSDIFSSTYGNDRPLLKPRPSRLQLAAKFANYIFISHTSLPDFYFGPLRLLYFDFRPLQTRCNC